MVYKGIEMYTECWIQSGEKQHIALMCAEAQTEGTVNSAGMSKHLLNFLPIM